MTITTFGTTQDGQSVQKITLSSDDLTVSLLTLGAIVQSVRLKGVAHDLTAGSDSLADYQGAMRFHGSMMGPVANRISNACAVIAGKTHQFDVNLGPHCLHSGSAGLHLKVWQLGEVTAQSCALHLTLPDGEGGFPGNRQVTARFSLTDATLRLDIHVETDAETLWNATNHSYWNLDGSPDWSGHSLQIHADRWLPTDELDRPTGEICPTAGGAMDFRQPRVITPRNPPLDHCFGLSDGPLPLRDVLILRGASGLMMTVATTEPGVQVYDGRNARRPGQGPYEALAIETQGWPDAPSYPAFPSISLMPGVAQVQSTEWRFTR